MQSMYEHQMSKLPQEFKSEWEKHISQFDYNVQGKATELVYFLEFVQARQEKFNNYKLYFYIFF